MITIEPEILEAMTVIEPVIARTVEEHEADQKLWMPSDLVPEGHKFPQLPPAITAMLVLNLLTEDGLPFFLAALVKHLGDEGAISEWSNLWTAEEDRHGSAIKRYLQNSLTREQWRSVEVMQYQYLRTGFRPDFSNDPYQLFAYVVLQELATQKSHAGIAKQSRNVDPVLQKLLGRIAAEESKHHQAYLTFFMALMEIDPSHAVKSLWAVVKKFQMPGHNVPGFKELATIQARTGVFGPLQLAEIIDKVWDKLKLGELSGLDSDAEKARDEILTRSQRMRALAENDARRKSREVEVPVVGQTVYV